MGAAGSAGTRRLQVDLRGVGDGDDPGVLITLTALPPVLLGLLGHPDNRHSVKCIRDRTEGLTLLVEG